MRLYPRLPPKIARDLATTLSIKPVEDIANDLELENRASTWAPTGGQRVTMNELEAIRSELRTALEGFGFSYDPAIKAAPADRASRLELDRKIAVILHPRLELAPSEAAHGGVWAFFGCVLAPELIRWRFPKEDGERGTTLERFTGNRQRNFYARLWWRAHLLYDPSAEDPYHLLDSLGEDEQVQITERSNIAGYRPLALRIGQGLVRACEGIRGISRSRVQREAMKRLRRLFPLLRVEALTNADLDQLIGSIYSDTLESLAVKREEAPPVVAWTDRRWNEVALDRRFALVEALSEHDIQMMRARVVEPANSWLEFDTRWKIHFHLDMRISDVLVVLDSSTYLRMEGRSSPALLGRWLADSQLGTWMREVVPSRGQRMLQSMRMEDARSLASRLGISLAQDSTQSAAQRQLRRCFGGDFQAIIANLDDEAIAFQLRHLRVELNDRSQREALAFWLCGDRAVATRTQLEYASPTGERPTTPVPETLILAATSPVPIAQLPVSPSAASAELQVPNEHRELPVKSALPSTRTATTPIDHSSAPLAGVAEPVGLIAPTLEKLRVRTVGGLLAISHATLAALPGVGPRKIAAIMAYQALVRGIVGDVG